jgi:hypothetical protein
VLDFGRLVFEGSPSEMLNSDIVRAAYLGSEGVAEGEGEGDGGSGSGGGNGSGGGPDGEGEPPIVAAQGASEL